MDVYTSAKPQASDCLHTTRMPQLFDQGEASGSAVSTLLYAQLEERVESLCLTRYFPETFLLL